MDAIAKFKVYWSKLKEVIYRSSFQNCTSGKWLLKNDVIKLYHVQMNFFKDQSLKNLFPYEIRYVFNYCFFLFKIHSFFSFKIYT